MRVDRLLAMALVLTLPLPAGAQTDPGLRNLKSNYNVTRTMNRLERVVRTEGFRVFARIDHSREADRAGILLRPTQTLIFGRPDAGSTLIQADQRLGIDLPMRFLVWLDDEGEVNISWNDPGWLVQRHSLIGHEATVKGMRQAIERLARDAGS